LRSDGKDWVAQYLVEKGYSLRLVSKDDFSSLYIAER